METNVKTPQAKRTVKTTEKSQAQTTKNNNDLFFSTIIEQLESVEEKHWQHFLKENVSFMPANRLSLQSYTRLNQFILALDMLINKRSNCYYATFNQITKSKGKIKKGSKSLPIQYFSYDIRHKETEERIEQKIFHAEIVVDNEKVATETEAYQKIPQILSFVNEQGEDKMKKEIESNYKQIKSDILNVVKNEIERIKNDPNLQHLVQ